jgi:hypothetical protein
LVLTNEYRGPVLPKEKSIIGWATFKVPGFFCLFVSSEFGDLKNLSELYPKIPNLVKFTPEIQSFPQFFCHKKRQFFCPQKITISNCCSFPSIHPSQIYEGLLLFFCRHIPFPFPAGKLNSDLHAIYMEIHRKGLRKFIPKKKKKNRGKVMEEEEEVDK